MIRMQGWGRMSVAVRLQAVPAVRISRIVCSLKALEVGCHDKQQGQGTWS